MNMLRAVCFVPVLIGLSTCPSFGETADVFKHPASEEGLAALSSTIAAGQIAGAGVLRADFSQVKKMKNLRFPLRSSGAFVFSPDHGTCWETRSPITNTFIITGQSFVQINHDGKRETFPRPKHPVFKQMETIFSSLFSGDVNALRIVFDVFLLDDGEQWTMGLMPRDEELGKVFASITVRGVSHDVQQIILKEKIGDETSIQFQNASMSGGLNEHERALFGE